MSPRTRPDRPDDRRPRPKGPRDGGGAGPRGSTGPRFSGHGGARPEGFRPGRPASAGPRGGDQVHDRPRPGGDRFDDSRSDEARGEGGRPEGSRPVGPRPGGYRPGGPARPGGAPRFEGPRSTPWRPGGVRPGPTRPATRPFAPGDDRLPGPPAGQGFGPPGFVRRPAPWAGGPPPWQSNEDQAADHPDDARAPFRGPPRRPGPFRARPDGSVPGGRQSYGRPTGPPRDFDPSIRERPSFERPVALSSAEQLGPDEEVVAGRRPVEEAFAARRPAKRLLVTPQRRFALEQIVLHATTLRIPIVEVGVSTR